MPTVQRKQIRRVETDLDVIDYLGVNTFSAESTILPGEFLTCKNLDLYRGGYLKSRYGSSCLNGIANKLGDYGVLNGVIWDVGGTDYLIIQQADIFPSISKFLFIELIPATPFSTVNNYGGGPLEITHSGASSPAQMMISNDRLYIFHVDGNLIVEFDGVSSFKGRSLGLAPAYFDSTNPIFPSGAGPFDGQWTYGIELVYRRGGSDFASSGITRLYDNFAQATTAHLSLIGGLFVKALAGSFILPAGVPTGSLTDGMCVRIWRSKNQFSESTDPLFPVDVQGSPDELYPRVIFTYDDFATALFSYSDFDLSDKVLIDAGDLTTVVEIATINDYIGLQPLPNAEVGTFHRDRIWVGAIPSIDSTRSRLAYSATAGTPYQEQYNPLNIVPCEPGDGQQITCIISFERDLIVIKEAKTLRVQDGDPANKAETMDHAIGLSHFKRSRFIPGVGIAGITNDGKDFMLFGYDLKWSNFYGDNEISTKIQSFISGINGYSVSIEYMNSKMFIADGLTKQIFVLHVSQGKGWTEYEYPVGETNQFLHQLIIRFGNGLRLLSISRQGYIVELEDPNVDTDIDIADDSTVAIPCHWKTHRYQIEGGRLMMEYRYYSVIAQLSVLMYGFSYVNGTPWPDPAGSFDTGKIAMVPNPSLFNPQSALKETDYKLFLPPPRPSANLFGFEFDTLAPCTIRSQRLNCIAFTGQLNPNFDPYSVMRFRPLGPPWTKPSAPIWQSEILLSFLGMDTTVIDNSGRQRTHVFSPGVGPGIGYTALPVMFPSTGARLSAFATSGLPGWTPATGVTYDGMETMGASPTIESGYTTWKMVIRLDGTLIEGTMAQGGDGLEFWQLNLLVESGAFPGQLEFRTYRGGTVARAWRSLDPIPNNQGDNRTILMFSYLNTGDIDPANDNFVLFMDDSGSQWGGRRRTTVESFDPFEIVVSTHSVFPGPGPSTTRDVALYQIETGLANEIEGKRFFEVMKNNDQPYVAT